MNIEIKNKKQERQHISFQKMLVIIVILISICVQVVFVGYSGYKISAFSNNIMNANLEMAHQNLLDNVSQTTSQVEDLFSFVTSNQFPHYVNVNLNLRDEAYVKETTDQIAKQCREAEIRSDVVKSLVLVGRNKNQKTLVYNFETEELSEYIGVEMNMLEDCGLQTELYQTLDTPMRLSSERLEEIEKTYDKDSPEYPAFRQLIELCKSYYVVSDIISNVLVLAFVDENAFLEGLDKQSAYGFMLMSENGKLILSNGNAAGEILEHLNVEVQQVSLDLYGYDIKNTKIQPEDLWAITVRENGDHFIKSSVILRLIGVMLLLNVLAFLLVHMLSKRLVRPLKLFERVMTHFQAGDKYKRMTERSAPFGRQLVASLLISCLIPFLLLNIFCNQIIGTCGKTLLEQYASGCVAYYENIVSEFQSACEQITTEHAVDMIYSFDSNNREENMQLIRGFEEKMLAQRVELSDYSYAIVVDSNYGILHQSMYSGRPELFRNIVNRATENGKINPMNKYYFLEKNPVSEGFVLVLQLPVMDDNQVIGTILIALEGTTIDSFAGSITENVELVWVYGDKSIYSSEHIQKTVGVQQLKQIAGEKKDTGKQYENYLIKVCKQDMLTDATMLVAVDVQEYTTILDSVLEDSLFMWLALTILIILITVFVMSLVLKPITEMTKKFSDNRGTAQTLEINTGVREINNLIRVYNDMVERQKQLQAENEKRYENEKHLITLRTQAEFKMLQHQINPHFLFNTLEAVNLLAMGDNSQEISDIVKALADILRFSLRGEQTVTAGEEVAALRKYLLIQNMRFGDMITFEILFDESLGDCPILKFLLQPLVENAISHGLHDKLEDGRITVRIENHEDKLFFEVSDNGAGMMQEELKKLWKSICNEQEEYGYTKSGTGIGLKNIYRRLRYYYGEEAGMKIESVWQKGTTVTLTLPKKWQR